MTFTFVADVPAEVIVSTKAGAAPEELPRTDLPVPPAGNALVDAVVPVEVVVSSTAVAAPEEPPGTDLPVPPAGNATVDAVFAEMNARSGGLEVQISRSPRVHLRQPPCHLRPASGTSCCL